MFSSVALPSYTALDARRATAGLESHPPRLEAIRVRRCAAGSDGSARGGSVGSNPLPMRESRSSGAMRSGRVAAEVDKTDHVEYACWSGVE